MSTKIKRKSERTKTKKIKHAPLKESYTDEEKVELKHKYTDILFHLSLSSVIIICIYHFSFIYQIFYQITMYMKQFPKM